MFDLRIVGNTFKNKMQSKNKNQQKVKSTVNDTKSISFPYFSSIVSLSPTFRLPLKNYLNLFFYFFFITFQACIK